ncbi:DMT family transporter [Melittangium boletus]|uniref:Membrane protein n=1 Tax=Melittangium boletus DSM 14713 TaxID=1294270 RepID=A0A250IM44_9BACT|nr:DMT family transporter [Melittangium boletus]ATB32338.1 membrane protein [Melittangium boletus DSM 14713]
MNVDSILFLVLGVIWGTNFLFMKEAVQVISPLQVAWLRASFGAVPILLFAFSRRSLAKADLRNAHHFAAMSILSIVVPYVSFVKGTQYLQSGAAGAISGIIPLMTAVAAALFLPKDRLSARKGLGLLLGLVGVAWVADVTRLFEASSSNALHGTLCMLLGSAGYASGMVYAYKFITPLKLSPIALAGYQTAGAALLLAFITPMKGVEAVASVPASLAALALGLGLLGTGIAFILYYRIIERLGAITASSVFYIPPVVALAVGALVGKEGLSLSQCLGTAVILLGVFLARNGAPA